MGPLLKTLSNESAQLIIDLYGGAITSFRLKDSEINPLSFRFAKEEMPLNNREGAPFQGHFLCLGRWGEPSIGEMKKAVPDHGEIANILWQALAEQPRELKMQATGKLEGLHIEREMILDKRQPVYSVFETVTNINPLGRLYNMVQHPTLAAPFLSNDTIINSNASQGFHYSCYKEPEKSASAWPLGINPDKSVVDLSMPSGTASGVFSFVVKKEDELGWITAYAPGHQLLLGYLWKREHYPWINVWHHFNGDRLMYRGLEFGTTGIHQPFRQILDDGNNKVFGENTFGYLDAGECCSRSYISFLYKVRAEFKEVESVRLSSEGIVINDRTAVYQSGSLDTILERWPHGSRKN